MNTLTNLNKSLIGYFNNYITLLLSIIFLVITLKDFLLQKNKIKYKKNLNVFCKRPTETSLIATDIDCCCST